MKKLGFSILFLLLLAFTPSLSMTLHQQESATESESGEWLSLLSEILSEQIVKEKLGKYFRLQFSKNAECQVCTMYLGAALNYAKLKNYTIDDFIMNKFCPMFPTEVKPFCNTFIKAFGPLIISSIKKHGSPDETCRELKFCENPKCNLFPKRHFGEVPVSESWIKYQRPENSQSNMTEIGYDPLAKVTKLKDKLLDRLLRGKITAEELDAIIGFIDRLEKGAGDSPFDWIKELIEKWTGNHTSPIDLDGDSFSQLSAELRGYHWRGRDCNDNDKHIYPGRKTDPHPNLGRDYDCNGIKGHNPKTKAAYKDELCKNSKQMGVVVMGDSVGAHAEIPRAWVDATMWNETTFKSIVGVALNEVDLPHMSGFTGYMDKGLTGPVRSVYKYLYERNKCNFRDYQNIAVNGASSGNCYDNNKRLSRNKTEDHPLLIILELVGNDVCNHRHSFDSMTTPEKFKANIIRILDYIDSVVPKGSHVAMLGLVNGSFLFEGVTGRNHPLGITYDDFFDYMNCIESSFCWGWLNTNASVRDKTTEKAMNLNEVYKQIVKTYKPKNFDFDYFDFPAMDIIIEYMQEGGDLIDLIEPTDGFHPSQLFNAKLGDHLWKILLDTHPDWLGPVNPNNDLITKLFGNQGGY